MPRPIDDTEMLATMAEDIVAGRAETPTGAMRLHGVERGSGQERRLLKKWAVHGEVLMTAMRRAERMREDALVVGFNLGRQNERDIRDAAMIAGTSALAQPDNAQAGGTQPPGLFVVPQPRPEPPSWWERITSRRAKVVE